MSGRAFSMGLALKTALVTGLASGLAAGVVGLLIGYRLAFLPSAAVAFVVGCVTLLTVDRLVVRRMRRAAEIASNIRQLGIAEQSAPVGRGDELDDLITSLEDASDAVADRIRRLRRIENYRQEFLGDVSHELQTPIFAVEGFAETLLDGALEDQSVNRSFVEKIHKNARRLAVLVNDLSDISQIETGSLRMNRVAFDPKQLAQESIEALELPAEQARVRLYAFSGQDVGAVMGDRERVRQVILNLLTNGIKYNNPGGSVEIALWRSGENEITFSVIDDGIGISADEVPRVTERFYRVDKSRSRERGGTGLGLAIVKHIVEAHGSSLLIQSRPGHGSTFSFALPAAPEPSPP
ncbi:MAG TPA: ATP-binding protein [Rhodothermales bacterium]|nr:ATP-binding protein [Rhodothermales bacterium]